LGLGRHVGSHATLLRRGSRGGRTRGKPNGAAIIDSQTAEAAQLQGPQAKSGDVRQDYAIALAGKAGFKLLGSSKVNANPKDTNDCPEGVWALPEKYSAIGESDRFVLKFAKPTEAK